MVRVLISHNDAAMQIEKDNNFVFLSYDKEKRTGETSGFICSNSMPNFWKESQSFDIHGLDEKKIEEFADFAGAGKGMFELGITQTPFNKKDYFKGTTFGGKSENSFGYVAMLLKVGMNGFKIETDVKWKWSSGDLIRYVQQIRWKTLKVNTL